MLPRQHLRFHKQTILGTNLISAALFRQTIPAFYVFQVREGIQNMLELRRQQTLYQIVHGKVYNQNNMTIECFHDSP